MEKLLLVIQREFLSKIRNKSFVVMTFLSPLFLFALGLVVFYVVESDSPKVKQIVVVDASSGALVKELQVSKSIDFLDYSAIGLEASKQLVRLEGYDGLLYIPSMTNEKADPTNSLTFYSDSAPGLLFVENLEKLLETAVLSSNLKQQGISQAFLDSSRKDITIKQTSFSGATSSKLGNGLKMGLGMGTGYLIMMFIVIYGTSVMRSVIEEKTNRIIEIMISSIKPFQLLLGKIIGNTGAGLLQFFCWGLLLLLFAAVAKFAFNVHFGPMSSVSLDADIGVLQKIATEISQLPLFTVFVFFIIYFVGGFMLYSAIYAAIGAAVDSETDTQQFVLPVITPLIIAVYVGFAAVMNDPHGTLAVIFSIVPFTAPIVMPMRIPFGVSALEIVTSVVMLLITFLGLVRMAGKIYSVGILMYGKKASYRELYQWLRR